MGRWSQYDEDEHRLPEGMRRVGYDADTQQYTYQDADGTYWEGAPGARYGSLRKVGTYPAPEDRTNLPNFDEDPKTSTTQAWRVFGPFLLLVGLVLLLFWQLLRGGNSGPSSPSPIPPAAAINCERISGQAPYSAYTVQEGDSCWSIATRHNLSLDKLKEVNEALNCDVLKIGTGVCVPAEDGKRN